MRSAINFRMPRKGTNKIIPDDPHNTPPAKIDYRLGELRLTDVPSTTLQALSQVPWPELGYQFRMDGNQAVLRTEAKP